MKIKLLILVNILAVFVIQIAGANSYKIGSQWFDEYRTKKINLINQETGGYRFPSAPYALLHGKKTKYSALLVHGLNDSPYYMKDIAIVLHSLGVNVITVLLPGHGVNPADLSMTSLFDWESEVKWGYSMASLVGEQVLLGGFSTGGTLAINEFISNFNSRIAGLLLFAPALRLNGLIKNIQFASCKKGLNKLMYQAVGSDTPVKYKERAINGVCLLYSLMEKLLGPMREGQYQTDESNLVNLAKKIKVPTFLAMADADGRLDSESTVNFVRSIPAPHKITYFATEGKPGKVKDTVDTDVYVGSPLLHSYLVLKTNEYSVHVNPYFFVLEQALKDFFRENFNQ